MPSNGRSSTCATSSPPTAGSLRGWRCGRAIARPVGRARSKASRSSASRTGGSRRSGRAGITSAWRTNWGLRAPDDAFRCRRTVQTRTNEKKGSAMAVMQREASSGYISRAPRSNGLADVLEILLDRGLVIDAFVRVSLVGIELLTVDLRVVVASVDTYLRFAEAVNRLDLRAVDDSKSVPELFEKGEEEGAEKKR